MNNMSKPLLLISMSLALFSCKEGKNDNATRAIN